MNIKRTILMALILTLILIGVITINPLGLQSARQRDRVPPLNPEHLTEEYEFKDTKVLWRIEEDKNKEK